MAFGFNFDLLDQLAFYGSYHNNKWNQVIHFIFVPVIYWTVLVWLSYTPAVAVDLPASLPAYVQRGAVLNGAFLAFAAYSAYYLTLDFVAGLAWGLLVGLPSWIGANLFQQQVDNAWVWALGLHVFAWYMQIHPGHAVLEKRRPALLDSFFQSLVLAPLFVLYELLFLLGYRPALRTQLRQRVEHSIAAWKAGPQALSKGVAAGDALEQSDVSGQDGARQKES